MTKLFIEEELNLDKTHFETLEEFQEYIANFIFPEKNESLVKEEAVNYGNIDDEKTYSEQLNLIVEQLKQVKDFRLMERIKDIILIHQLEEEQENINIPKAHQELVMSRFEKVRKDAGRLLDWEEAKNKLKS